MKSVGEAMAIGRTFKQAFAKALRSRELDLPPRSSSIRELLLEQVAQPGPERFDHVLAALRLGVEVEEIHRLTQIDPWFLHEMREIVGEGDTAPAGVRTFKAVDTCAAEFAARTPYFYSSWERPPRSGAEHEVPRGERESVVILGSGPNRIGQGIEFDYCCVHAAQTVRASGRDAVMINCNPETVSTDYDTSDRLYFEPLTLADVLAVCELERPLGVVVQFGGQTPLKLAQGLYEAGISILGTGIDAIDIAEDRARFGALLDSLGYKAPPYATAAGPEEALDKAPSVGFPLLVRPSYVLGGRAMEIVYDLDGLASYLDRVRVSGAVDRPAGSSRGTTIYLDRFLEDSIEIDVDALCDGHDVWIAGVMQHVEEAGIHSGDSACVLPPHALGDDMLEQIREQTAGIALALGVVGLLNVQFAIHGEEGLHVIEANPRASRTVPFVSKAIGLPVAKLACRVMLGERIPELKLPRDTANGHVCVKEAVLPFDRFAGFDALLGPEMRSTGEVMGIARDFPTAFAKAQAAAGARLPTGGTVFITVADADKPAATGIAGQLHSLGFEIVATRGTAMALNRMGIPARAINKIAEGSPHVVDWIERGDVDLVINTPIGTGARTDGYEIRTAAAARRIPCITTMSGGMAAARAIAAAAGHGEPPVISLQEIYGADRDAA
jgi:carbamoyl-phosphate synthase large subunit